MSSYFGYGAAKDTVYQVGLRPNPLCGDTWCRLRQKERRAQLVERGLPENAAWDAEARLAAAAERERLACEANAKPLHEDNEFQIELIGSSDSVKSDAIESCLPDVEPTATTPKEDEGLTGDPSLEDLMKQLKSL